MDLENYQCSNCKFYNKKRRCNNNRNLEEFYVEERGACSNNHSRKFNSIVKYYDRNTSCFKRADDVEAIIKRRKLEDDSKLNIKKQEANTRLINADTYRIQQLIENERKERERLEIEKLKEDASRKEAKRISEMLNKLDPTDKAIYEGQNSRILNGSIYC